MKNKNKKGFTLIELLIVIGIVAILSGIVLVAVNPATQFGKANDAERKSDLNAIVKGIYQYQTSPSSRGQLPQCLTGAGQTPLDIPTCDTDASGPAGANGAFEGALQLGTTADATHYNCTSVLVPFYIREMPIDPDTGTYDATSTGYYICQEGGEVYVISEGAEVFTDDGGCQIPGDTTEAMCIAG